MTDCEGFDPNNLQRAPSPKRGREHDDPRAALNEEALRLRGRIHEAREHNWPAAECGGCWDKAIEYVETRALLAASVTEERRWDAERPLVCPSCGVETPAGEWLGLAASATEEDRSDDPLRAALDVRLVAKAVLLTTGFDGESIEPADLSWAKKFIRQYAALAASATDEEPTDER